MAAKPILNVRLAPETLRKLDAVAAATRRTRSFIANEALQAWIDREAAIIEDIQIGLEEMRAGKVVPHEQVMRDLDSAIDRAAAQRRPRRAGKKQKRASR